jgi:DnaJ-class molecular chaperone
MAVLTNVLVIGKILALASNIIGKEWKSPAGTTAQRCPVCEGSGEYTTDFRSRNCHGCDGKGWVTV